MKIAKKAGAWLLLAILAALSCDRPGTHQDPGDRAPGVSAVPEAAPPAASASAGNADAANATLPDAGETSSPAHCPAGMVLIEGDFCPVALQRCAKHHAEWEKRKDDPTVSERCLEYAKPSKCLSPERRKMRFCIDLYEWPNKRGELPTVLVQWVEAKKQCGAIGKRLCDEEEWLFACEGEEMLPHVYGYVRDPTKCQIDRPYIKRDSAFKRYAPCMADPECKAAFDKLDQRKPAGSFPECISPFGVYDLNGSINEWVNLPGAEKPNRSGLKGGWWGPVRSRCRPTVKFHKEEDWGYEAGFRCCTNAKGQNTQVPMPGTDAAAADAVVSQAPAAPAKARKREPSVPDDASSPPPAASAPIEVPPSPASGADGSP